MKRYLYLVLVALIATAPLSLVSCSSDDDEKEKGNEQKDPSSYAKYIDGKVKVHFASSDKESTYYSTSSDWVSLYQNVQGSSKYDSDNGYTFSSRLSFDFDYEIAKNKAAEYEAEYGKWVGEDFIWLKVYLDFSWLYWQFQTKGDIHEGDEIHLTGIFWNDNAINRDQEDGKVYVKSIKDDKITLSFQDLKFQRCRSWKVGSSEFEQLTVNGEITFTAEK